MDNRPSLSGKRNYRGLEIETKTSPSGRGRTFFLTSLFIELINWGFSRFPYGRKMNKGARLAKG